MGIIIGNNTGINAHAYFGGQGGIEIGENVIIGPYVKIFLENLNYNVLGINIKDQGETRAKVIIRNNCWLGSGVTILSSIYSGERTVVCCCNCK